MIIWSLLLGWVTDYFFTTTNRLFIIQFQNEREKFGSIDFTVARCNLNALCQRVHKLDVMSKRVLEDVEALEPVVDKAESNLTNNTEAKLKSLLKPLFFVSPLQ